MSEPVAILNSLALIFGWAFLCAIGVVIVIVGVGLTWCFLMEQIWQAGQRVQYRRAAQRLPADGDLSRHEQAGTTGREI